MTSGSPYFQKTQESTLQRPNVQSSSFETQVRGLDDIHDLQGLLADWFNSFSNGQGFGVLCKFKIYPYSDYLKLLPDWSI